MPLTKCRWRVAGVLSKSWQLGSSPANSTFLGSV
jgi:hypothetical protein